jgi:FKBP-type peptidyl-prolyl cis-trans isomerase
MKINFSAKNVILAISAMAALTACENSPYPGYEKSESGLYSKFYTQAENGVKPKEGDVIQVQMLYKNSKDSVLFDSKKNPNGNTYIEFPVGKSTFQGSFEEALMSMSVGDSASFIISADSVYNKTFMVNELPPYIDKGSMLTFEAKLLKVTSKDEVEKERNKRMEEQKVMMELRKNEEPKALAKYLEDNKITAKPNASGLYYIEKSKGKGAKPAEGQMVKVKYTGRLLDGTVFDTSEESEAKKAGIFDERRAPYEPIEFPLGPGSVIEGWVQGIAMMQTGTKATLIIPSSLGYGESGNGPIPPYSTLVFDVELVGISDAPAGQGMPGMK